MTIDHLIDQKAPVALAMIPVIEYVRGCAWRTKDKEGLAKLLDLQSQRLRYFVREVGSMPDTEMLDKLIKHFMPDYVIVPAESVAHPVVMPDANGNLAPSSSAA
ncbi:MAG: hypothetical protein E5Y02_10360 [Mesorhizobium sp.]|nr:MAG: hypothetical protein E5Y02_10360 [Mesorhizobium sp.]